MPHQCTNCNRTFPDGSKEMLSGCPDCGGNRFQFAPTMEETRSAETDNTHYSLSDFGESDAENSQASQESTRPDSDTPLAQVDSDAADGTSHSMPAQTQPSSDSVEDKAQATARTDVVSPHELPHEPPKPINRPSSTGGTSEKEQDIQSRPSLEELRQELNDQFESIKIVEPGQYELNLMELYDREEYIVSLQEDGRYVIDVPDSWRSDQ